MSYPWGDMSYPTFERAEGNGERFAETFYREYENMLYQASQLNELRGNAKFDGMFLSTPKGDDELDTPDKEFDDEFDTPDKEFDDEFDCDDSSYPSTRQEIDAAGIALARAFISAGIDEDDLNYLVRDISSILDDRIVSYADRETGEYIENAYRHDTIDRIRDILSDPEKLEAERKFEGALGGKTVEQSYRDEFDRLEGEIKEFESRKSSEMEKRFCDKHWRPNSK